MRSFSVLPIVALVGSDWAERRGLRADSCTGLCLQQTTCTGNATTSVSGVVYAPNGTDPLPNVTVYVPNDTVQPFSAGVSCPMAGAPPSGSPLVGTITDVNGKFTLVDMPVGANIPIVARLRPVAGAVDGEYDRMQQYCDESALCRRTIRRETFP